MIPPFTLSLFIYCAPVLIFMVYKIRRASRAAAHAEHDALPFNPSPEAASFALLRRFTAPQRVYLMQQLKLAAGLYGVFAWVFLFILSLPIFNVSPNADRWFVPSALVWFQFVHNATGSLHFLGTMILCGGFIAISPLRFGTEARFYRTRPLSIGFLFWSRVLPLLIALLLAAMTGIVLAIALLVAVKGPVWHNLPAVIPRVLGPDDADLAQEYFTLLATSVPRIFLSLLTSISLVFTGLLAVFSVPLFRLKSGNALPASSVLILMLFLVFSIGELGLLDFVAHRLPSVLFVYTRFGPPPPYIFALVPIALSVVFITLARLFVDHLEV